VAGLPRILRRQYQGYVGWWRVFHRDIPAAIDSQLYSSEDRLLRTIGSYIIIIINGLILMVNEGNNYKGEEPQGQIECSKIGVG
jgi:hypothetical protein